MAQGECSGGHSRGERAGVQREPGPGRDRASVCPAQGFRKGPKAQPSCRPLATGKVAGPHSLGSGEATLPQEPDLCQGSGCPEGVPHSTPAAHPGTRLSSSQSAVPWVAAGETEVGGLAQSTKCQTPSGGNHPSARPHCVTRGSRGAAGPKAQGAWAGPLWAAPSWRASSPVLSPGESAWTSVAICLGLSPARGDLAAELCWGWGEAEDEGPSDPLQALGLARMAATWLSSEAIPRPHAGWGCSSGRGRRSASQPPASRAPAGHSVLSRQEDFGGCGSGCLPSTPAQCPLGPGLRPPSRANSGPAGLPMVPAKPEVPGVGAPETGQAQVGQGAPRVLHRGNQSSGTVTVRLGRALCP